MRMLRHVFQSARPQTMWVGCVSAIALTLASCTAPSTSPTSEETGDIQVVTTFLPMTQFTQAVVGDRATVTQLLPANVGPHDFQAKPGDVEAIATADVLVQNGLELEFFLDDLIDNAGNSTLVIIDSSEGIETLALEKDHSGEEHHEKEDEEHHDEEEHGDHHDDEHGDHHDASEDEEHHDESGHEDAHAHGSVDPHIWLDPKRAMEQVANIRDGLIAADPAGEAEYTANAAAYIEKLQDLDTDIAQRLAPYADQTFISFHDFAAYFAESYGLNSEFLVNVPEANPSPDDMRRIVETTQANNIKALLTEPSTGESSFAALAKDLNIQVGEFDAIATGDGSTDQLSDYFTVMQQNVENLESALSGNESEPK